MKKSNLLITVSSVLFSISIPTSMALDNTATAISAIALIVLLFEGKKVFKEVDLRSLGILLIPQGVSSLVNPSLLVNLPKFTDINHHLFAYFVPFFEKRRFFIYILAITSTLSALSVLYPRISLFFKHHHSFGFFNNPLTTAGVLFVLFFLMLSECLRTKKPLFLFPSLFSVIAIFELLERSYYVAIFVFVIFAVLFFAIKSRKLAVLLFVLSIAGAWYFWHLPKYKARFLSSFQVKADSSIKDRLSIWLSYVKSFKEDYSLVHIFFGYGERCIELAKKHFPESFKQVWGKEPTQEDIKNHFYGGEAHNIYIKMFSKYGLFGLLGYLGFFGYVIAKNLRIFKPYSLVFASGYLGFLSAGFFENNFTDAEIQYALLFTIAYNLSLLKREVKDGISR